jgi:hypothetical protein
MAAMVVGLGFWLKAERVPRPDAGEPRPVLGSAVAVASARPTAVRPGDTATATATASVQAPLGSATVAPSSSRGVVLFANTADSTPVEIAGGAGEGDVSDYDVASALKALNRVYYGDCRVPSAGQIAVTFATSGRVKKVAVVQGDYDERTLGCIAARFGAAGMHPFRGVPQTVTASLESTP